jgi:putative Ca2+/H+ antiporter (TMEM165/GDT1 family)
MAVSSYLHAKAWEALVKSFGVIAVSEIGDKTFFIAAVMAMKNARITVSEAPGAC